VKSKSALRPGIENLKPARKGEPGRNPTGSNGATKKRAEDAALMKEILERDWVHDKDGKHVKVANGRKIQEAMFEAQVLKALKGDTIAFNSIMDIARGGKLPQAVTNADGGNITIPCITVEIERGNP
jgi:protein involved in sex pheromone biosynthesis